MHDPQQPMYYVVTFVAKYQSLQEVQETAPTTLAEHITRSKRFLAEGKWKVKQRVAVRRLGKGKLVVEDWKDD